MALNENLKYATDLKEQLDQLRPISPVIEQRIMQKFRLDWNYNSSNIEGNTLTYGETKALILFGHTAQAKPLRDHLEMSGHDEAIKYVEEIVTQKRPLNENFIRELHKLVLREPYQIDAKTEDGKLVKKWIKIGQYKALPNHVETQTGEMFYFASPEETPAKMNDLLNWYNKTIESEEIHPIVFATEFHYRFIRIHPFDDGNGRIARLLMNFLLMQKAYPPAIIKSEEKNDYYIALQQADAGQLEFFFDYVCQQVIHSLELMIKGANGEDIEEQFDLDKKLKILKIRLGEDINSQVKIRRSPQAIRNVFDKCIMPLIVAIEEKLKDFDALAKSRSVTIKYGNGKHSGNNFINVLQIIRDKYINRMVDQNSYVYPINIECLYSGLKNINFFGVAIVITFHDFNYEIKPSGPERSIIKRYDQFLTEKEIQTIVTNVGNFLYNSFEDAYK